MKPVTVPVDVLAHYGAVAASKPADWVAIPAGLSGARLWHCPAGAPIWLLRQWPAEHPSGRQLALIHALLDHLAQVGFPLTPRPERTTTEASFFEHAGHRWELARWLPGSADFAAAPTDAKAAAAAAALAQFHRAAASFVGIPAGATAPANLVARFGRARSIRVDEIERLRAAIQAAYNDWSATALRICELLEPQLPRVVAELVAVVDQPVPVQACWGDAWHDNVLFVGEQVSGLVDFSAVRADCVAADVARLLGSMTDPQSPRWRLALAAYEAQRPLSDAERRLLPIYDRSGIVLSALNWLVWLFVERREFAARDRVTARLEHLLQRLDRFGNV